MYNRFVAVLTGHFCALNRHARESSYSKASLGTVPPLPVAVVNKDRQAITDFKRHMRAQCHDSILECYHEYNRKGGSIVPMQTGGSLYFTRACIFAIYADQPAATKCTLTGSACPVCYTGRNDMAVPIGPRVLHRTDANMHERRALANDCIRRRSVVGISTRVRKTAKREGVQLGDLSPWSNYTTAIACPDDWVFGPDPHLDNVYQCVPQVNLHGFDEGLVLKLNYCTVMTFIDHVAEHHGMSKTEVRNLTYALPT